METKKGAARAQESPVTVVADNRRARFDYHILDRVEAGLALTGTEIKAIREGRVNLRDSYARINGREVWLFNAHIAPYSKGGRYNHDPIRPRKLLLHRRQIVALASQTAERGYTLVPLRLLLRRGRAKIEIAVARGKKQYDKREAVAKQTAQREIARALRRRE